MSAIAIGNSVDFGEALRVVKTGGRVYRKQWRNTWVAYSPGRKALEASSFWAAPNREYAAGNGGSASVLGCLTVKLPSGEIQMGWIPSQADMLADDWYVLLPPRATMRVV